MASSASTSLNGLREELRNRVSREVLLLARAVPANVTSKDGLIGHDFVTDIDLSIQAYLKNTLTSLLPSARFVGEEEFADIADPGNGLMWIADPLDGTVNFVSGLPFCACSIALLSDGVPLLAMVVDLTVGTVWDAEAGRGATRDGVAITFDPRRAQDALISVSSGTVLLDAQTPGLGLLARLRRASPRLRILGSQALQLCYAAEGRLRLAINREAKLWDDAAGWLICREAGAAYALAARESLFPLKAGSDAAQGNNIFSIAGEPRMVAEVASHIRQFLGTAPHDKSYRDDPSPIGITTAEAKEPARDRRNADVRPRDAESV
jgi:myo-inositol-1(or 4)-monophosphatase